MKLRLVAAVLAILSVCSSSFDPAEAQSISSRKIAEGIFFLESPENEDQLLVVSEKGLVVFNTFWPSMVAQRSEIVRIFGRDDFYMLINMVDRLDMLGSNAAYEGIKIVGHKSFLEKYTREKVDAEVRELIDMWRWKEDVSKERLPTHEPGSKEEANERAWMNTCRERAEELEKGFDLVLPNVVFEERKTLDLGDRTIELIWFGKAGNYIGMSVAVFPEAKIAVIPSFIIHPAHLAPHPHPQYAELDVPRWIEVLEEVLEGDDRVDRVICGIDEIWTRDRALTRLHYIRTLWKRVGEAERKGMELDEVQELLSLDAEFGYVKELPIYAENGDDWVRPQHRFHVSGFYLQHKNPASEILRKSGKDSFRETLARIRKERGSGGIYFNEGMINGLGYELMNTGRTADAIEIFRLNVEVFPLSANVYDSLGEAYMNSGETEKAIENYRKSLELDPGNDNAREMLKKLGDI